MDLGRREGEADPSLADLILRSATDFAIVTSTTEGVISSWSPGAHTVMGWTAAAAIGRPVDIFFTPEDVAAGRPAVEMRCAREQGRAADERWHMRKDGSRFWASGEMQPLVEGGEIVGFVKIIRDRTEHYELEQRLTAAEREASQAVQRLGSQEQRLRELFESAPGFIAVFRGPDFVYELVNASYLKLVGHRDVLGKPILEALPELVGQGYLEKLNAVYESGKALTEHTMPVMLQQSLGAEPELRHVDYVFQPMRGVDGRIDGLFLEGFDVTDAVTARTAADKVAAEQAAILGQLAEGVIATDASGRITFVNAAAERIHGVAHLDVEPEAYSETYRLLMEDGASYPSAELPLARAVERGETVTDARWRIRRPDGTEVLAIGNARPVVVEDRQVGAVLTVRDDTQRHEAEAALKTSERRLQAITDSIDQMIWSTRPDGYHDYFNARWYEYTGTPPGSTDGEGWADLFHPDDQDRTWAAWNRSLATGEPYHIEYRLRHRSGQYRWVIGRALPVLDDAGAITRWYGTCTDVHDLREAAERLRATEERYRLAARATNDAVWDWDLLADRILWNDALRDAFGYAIDGGETNGAWWIEHIHPDDRARIDAGMHAVIDGTQDSWSDEYRFVRADGSVAHIFDRGTVIRDADGRAVRMIGAMLDLTERQAAEAALRSSETRYRTLFEAIDAGFCVIELVFDDADGAVDYRFLEINPAFEKQSGLSDAIGRSIRELAPDTEQRWVDFYAGVAAAQGPRRYEDFFPGLDRWFDVYAYPVDAPELRRVAVLFNDITVRKRAEEELTQLNRTLETRVAETVAERDMVWRTSQDLFAILELEGQYRNINPAWGKLLGYAPADVIGKRPSDFVHPDDMEALQQGYRAILAGEPVEAMDVRMQTADGALRWISWTATPQGDVFAASGRDVTARKELGDQLRQSQKMEAVGQLTGGIAHDFNNLLTIVSGNIDMARRSLGPDGDARALRSLGNAAKGADRAAALTQRLLAFSRRQPLQPRATDVNKLLAGMTELLDRALGETVDLQVVAGAGLWRVEVDPNQLENAILNLAVNARDAMSGGGGPVGGKLTIETGNAHIDDAYAAAQREVAPGQYVLVSVTDTGEGMPPEIVAKAFDPFFSTKEVGKGTGLGLSQVYGYVKQSGGHVKIYSEAGEGTTVKLYLPRLIADMNAADEEEAEVAPAAHGQESILVVEDDDDVRIFTVDSLRELGYRVLEAHDGASALRLLERQEEAPRLLLTDVVMPGMSGRELADRARSAYPDMRVLFTTGYARNAIVHGGRLDPGVELLPKPFTYEALAAKVREVIDKSAVDRALVIDPSATDRAAHAAMLGELGFAAEPAATVREALGKLRAVGGSFDVVVLSDAVPVGDIGAMLAELHAVRRDLAVLVTSSVNAGTLARQYSDRPCVGVLPTPFSASELRQALAALGVSCASDELPAPAGGSQGPAFDTAGV